MKKEYMKTILIAIVLLLITLAMLISPKDVIKASTKGLTIWWGVVFPSLLPFFVLANLLIRYGVVSLIGALLEPVMRPIFRVPGVGGFAFVLGLISGFPAGAKLTAELRKENLITKTEGERLVCFTNSANPLFIFGAVAVGFFHRPEIGLIIALAHYGGNICIGILMRFYRYNDFSSYRKPKTNFLTYAFGEMHRKRLQEYQPFGKIFGEAIINSVNTLLMIGGFIIIFSVLNSLLWQLKYIPSAIEIIGNYIPSELIKPLFSGILEMTIGVQSMSKLTNIPLTFILMGVSFIIGFSGFSIHAQVASILAATDISYLPFFWSKILHGTIASIFTYLLLKHTPLINEVFSYTTFNYNSMFFFKYGPLLTIWSLILYTTILFYKWHRKTNN